MPFSALINSSPFHIASSVLIRYPKMDGIQCIAWHPMTTHIAVGLSNGDVWIWKKKSDNHPISMISGIFHVILGYLFTLESALHLTNCLTYNPVSEYASVQKQTSLAPSQPQSQPQPPQPLQPPAQQQQQPLSLKRAPITQIYWRSCLENERLSPKERDMNQSVMVVTGGHCTAMNEVIYLWFEIELVFTLLLDQQTSTLST